MRILAILAFLVLGFAYPSSANEWKALSDFSLAHLEKLKSSCSYRIAYSITSPFEKETFLFIDQLNVYPESPEGYDQQLIVHIP
ncbi:MAG: hypothetical protein KDD55_12190, partial [Bdellovibrionales bacterium]|nr:hypothetical protein [Bdellovibrionales bacterium]